MTERVPVVGIDASRFDVSEPTGTERYSHELIRHVIKLEDLPVRLRLYVNAGAPPPGLAHYSDVRCIPFPRLWTHVRLSWEVTRRPVDVLFVPSHVLPLRHPRRSVVTIHDLGYMYEPETHTTWSRLQLRLTTRWNANRASQIVAVSESTARDIVRYTGAPRSKVHVIHSGVDEAFRPLPPPAVDRARRLLGLPDRYLLAVGTIQPRKNLVRLIAAFERAGSQHGDLALVIAGKPGWLSGPILKRIDDSPLRHRIVVLGHVPDSDLPTIYNAAEALVFPSLHEGFGLPALEAMACGIPVVVSDRGALPEITGGLARVVDPEDPYQITSGILDVLAGEDPSCREMRLEHARLFTWERCARMTAQTLIDAAGADP